MLLSELTVALSPVFCMSEPSAMRVSAWSSSAVTAIPFPRPRVCTRSMLVLSEFWTLILAVLSMALAMLGSVWKLLLLRLTTGQST